MLSFRFSQRLAGMAGNILEHYDNALFGFLAPFIAPLFFDDRDPVTALILTYCMLPLGLLMRPLGSLFFGWIGDLFGRPRALFFSLVGMAMATFMMGCLPVYREVGIYAPILLCLGRVLQNFCAAGEISGGAIFVLEHTEPSQKNLMSAIYGSTTVAGILLASFMVTLFSYWGDLTLNWRILFWLGGGLAVLGFFFRFKSKDAAEYLQSEKRAKSDLWPLIVTHRSALLAIICVSGFGYTTYSLPFVLMNGYIPLVTTLTKTQVMGANTVLLFVDMLLLPVFGYLATKINREKIMFLAALISIVTAIPVFSLLKGADLATVMLARCFIVTLGVAFSATYHAWAQEQVPPAVRYTLISLGYAIGSQLIGNPASAICLWMYKKMGWAGSPALYLMFSATLAALAVRRAKLSVRTAS